MSAPASSPRASRLAWVLFGATLACLAVAVWLGYLTRNVEATDWQLRSRGGGPSGGRHPVVPGGRRAGGDPAAPQRDRLDHDRDRSGLLREFRDGFYAVYAMFLRPELPGGAVVASLSQWTWVPVFAMAVTFLLLLFPDGHLSSPRWRWFAWVTAVDLVGREFGDPPGPGQIDSDAARRGERARRCEGSRSSSSSPSSGSPIAVLASAASLILRLRRATGHRACPDQVAGHGAAIVAAVYTFVLLVLAGSRLVGPRGSSACRTSRSRLFGLIPVAIGVSVLRYRLFDIDVVIRKAVVIGLLAGFITIAYIAIVVALGALFGVGTTASPASSAVAAAAVAFAFPPVRRWARRASDRAVYGKRATPYEVLTEFGDQLAGSYAADDVLVRMARVLAEGSAPRARGVAPIADSDSPRPGASTTPRDDERTCRCPTPSRRTRGSHSHEAAERPDGPRQGEARRRPRRAGRPGAPKRRADRGAPARLEELRASRAAGHRAGRGAATTRAQHPRRCPAAARGAEREDATSRSGCRTDPARADLLAELKSESTGPWRTCETSPEASTRRCSPIRAWGPLLRPRPARVPGRSHGRIRWDRTFPQEVEAAVYFCCLEALQNVGRYADASKVTLRLSPEGTGTLNFEVSDDGRGFDPASTGYGTGLQGMADRLAALEGTLSVVDVRRPARARRSPGPCRSDPTDDRVADKRAPRARIGLGCATPDRHLRSRKETADGRSEPTDRAAGCDPCLSDPRRARRRVLRPAHRRVRSWDR